MNKKELEARITKLENELEKAQNKYQPHLQGGHAGDSPGYLRHVGDSELVTQLKEAKNQLARLEYKEKMAKLEITFPTDIPDGKCVYAIYEKGHIQFCGRTWKRAQDEVGCVKGQGEIIKWEIRDNEIW